MAYGTVNADVIGTSVAGSNLGAGNASIMKNRLINGDFKVSQYYGTSATANTINGYAIDRWQIEQDVTGKLIAQQNQGSVTPPVGFANYFGVTSQSAYSVGASERFALIQYVEGYNMSDLNWGTANAKTVTLSFWAYSSLTGTFGGSFLTYSGTNYSYPFSYSIPVANTWTYISITVPGPSVGSWATNNAGALQLSFSLGCGSTYTGTAGSWQNIKVLNATGATSVVGTNGATFYITGVQLEVGSSATGFEYVNYQTSLANCMRYYYKLQLGDYGAINGFNDNSTNAICYYQFPVPMRSAPTLGTTGTASNYGLRWAGSNTNLSSVPAIIGTGSVGATRIQAIVASGLTVAAGCGLISAVDTNPIWLAFSAEL
jgi:hypothetical protein